MLKVQAHAARTISWWRRQSPKIDFEPPYQRKGNLWGDKDKAYLIDSILNEYDIPKIYLADFTILNSNLNSRNLPYAVIDGRQRLEAILSFYNDQTKLNDDFVYFNAPDLRLGGYTYSMLSSEHPEIAEIFDEFNLDVMSVISDDIQKINDLFVRLNRSKALTGAELRNAMQGIVPDMIRGIVDSPFFKEKIKFSTTRGQDSNVAAKILLLEYTGDFIDTKKKQLDRFTQEGATTEYPEAFYDAANRAKKTINQMERIFSERDPLLSTHGPIPIYYFLVKNTENPEYIRDFLVEFSHLRKENQEISKTEPRHADSRLLAYDGAVRSINDAGSIEAATNIISEMYREYLDDRAYKENYSS